MGDDLIIFATNGASPITDASRLREALELEIKNHPETDIFRLYHHFSHSQENPPNKEEDFSFETFLTADRTKASRYVRGNYALVIPAAKRGKVADIFLNFCYPIDKAIELASYKGLLNVRVASYNHFILLPRTYLCDRVIPLSQEQKVIAVCLSAYRVENMERLLNWACAENYPSTHFFVAVKDIPESIFRRLVLPRWQSIMKSGRLSLRLFPGKNPASDLLDSVRDLDTSGIDHFLMLRETDMPIPGFLWMLNDFHAAIPCNHSTYYKGKIWGRQKSETSPWKERNTAPSCFSLTRKALATFHDLEQSTQAEACGDSADDLLFKLIMQLPHRDMTPYLEQRLKFPLLWREKEPPARGSEKLRQIRQSIRQHYSSDPSLQEHVIEIHHPSWNDQFRIIGDDGWQDSMVDHAKVLAFDGEKLDIKWDKWGREFFLRDKQGVFRLSPHPLH